jgi:hypothetical protein
MSKRTITINISPAGNSSIEANGFTGKACEDATAEIELALGGQAAPKKRKPEYYAPATTAQGTKLTF